MNTAPPPKRPTLKRGGPKLSSAEAQTRLADALRENLRRRKAQLRARDQKDAAVDKSGTETDAVTNEDQSKTR